MELFGWPRVFIGCGCSLGLLHPISESEWKCGFCNWRGKLERNEFGTFVQK